MTSASATDDIPTGDDLVPVQAKVPRGLVEEVRRATDRSLSDIIRAAFAAVAGVSPDAYPVAPRGGWRNKEAA